MKKSFTFSLLTFAPAVDRESVPVIPACYESTKLIGSAHLSLVPLLAAASRYSVQTMMMGDHVMSRFAAQAVVMTLYSSSFPLSRAIHQSEEERWHGRGARHMATTGTAASKYRDSVISLAAMGGESIVRAT